MKVLLALAVALAVTGTASASSEWSSNTWRSPTGNIICAYRQPEHSIDCMTRNNGIVLTMPRYARAHRWYDNSVRIHPFSPILHYGQSWASDAMRCTSRFDGMLCRTAGGTHGFFLARDAGKDQTW